MRLRLLHTISVNAFSVSKVTDFSNIALQIRPTICADKIQIPATRKICTEKIRRWPEKVRPIDDKNKIGDFPSGPASPDPARFSQHHTAGHDPTPTHPHAHTCHLIDSHRPRMSSLEKTTITEIPRTENASQETIWEELLQQRKEAHEKRYDLTFASVHPVELG